MHSLIKHIPSYIGNILLFFFIILTCTNAISDQSVEEIINERKGLFSKNYKTAKRVQALSNKAEFEDAKDLMLEMSSNYLKLLNLFPDNTKQGFKTEALPTVWSDKEGFNMLMKKSSTDMLNLAKIIEDSENINADIKKMMWANCNACHSKYRAPH